MISTIEALVIIGSCILLLAVWFFWKNSRKKVESPEIFYPERQRRIEELRRKLSAVESGIPQNDVQTKKPEGVYKIFQ